VATSTINRNSDPAGYDQPYSILPTLAPGQVSVTVQFYADLNGQGTLVGSAFTPGTLTNSGALVDSHGNPLDILTMGTVARVVIPAGQTVPLGSPTQLTFSALDSFDHVLAVSPGSALWSAFLSGSAVTSSGVATGILLGSSQVWVEVDGASIQGYVTVVASGNYFALNQTVQDLVYNPVDGNLYASVPETASHNPNCIVAIDPTTGLITKSVFVGSEPSALALTPDGSTLYVGLDGSNSVRTVSLPSLTPGSSFTLGSGTSGLFHASNLAVMPGSPNTVVAALRSPTDSSATSLVVFGSGIPRTNSITDPTLASDSIAFGTSSSTLFGSGEFGGMVYTINANGIQHVSSLPGVGGNETLQKVASDIFASNGAVLDATSGSLLGTFPTGFSSTWEATNSQATQAYLVTRFGPSSMQLQVTNPATFTSLGTVGLPLSTNETLNAAASIGTSTLALAIGVQDSEGMVVIVKDALQGLSTPSAIKR
jgi:hypothetical protein